jgi:hypothetical protein
MQARDEFLLGGGDKEFDCEERIGHIISQKKYFTIIIILIYYTIFSALD